MAGVGRRRVLLGVGGVVASVLAGCSGDGDGGPADRGPIAIAEVGFAAEQPSDFRQYEPQPEATYERGQPVWLYADYEGLAGEPLEEPSSGESDTADAGDDGVSDGGVDGGDDSDGSSDDSDDGGDGSEGGEDDEPRRVEIDLHQTVTVEDPDGDAVVEGEEIFRGTLTVPQLDRYFTGTEILLPGDAAPGEYETTLTVTDRVSETEDSATATFRFEG